MGFYDIDKKYTEDTPLTMSALCREILEDIDGERSTRTEEDIRALIKNNKKTGIIDRIKKYLHYDIENHALTSDQNRFEMFQLLKIIFSLETRGEIKPIDSSEERQKGIKIINILSKPSLENINTTFSNNSQYGDYYDNLLYFLNSEKDNHIEQADAVYSINHDWENFNLKEINILSISNFVHYFPLQSLEKLEALNLFLTYDIIPLLKKYKNIELPYTNGVFYTFTSILIAHFYISVDTARVQIYNETPIPHISLEKKMWFNKNECKFVDLGIIDRLMDYLKGNKNDDKLVSGIINFVNLDNRYSKSDIKYVISHIRSVINLVSNYRMETFDNKIDITLLIILIEETLSIKKDNIGYKNDYVGYNNISSSLSRALLNFDGSIQDYKFPPILGLAWETRIENRVAASFNLSSYIQLKRNIEKAIYDIKSFIYSQKNINDMFELHRRIYRTIVNFNNIIFDEKVTEELLFELEYNLNLIFKIKNKR